ncbi:DUF1499 domain-containing protein [Shimia marina]|uniref:DUF1499 domain-containing protein n=1 Tax=Shimia marina TaxID=321267 RepID=A0A0P1ERY2_9RHOB|nr:DUF1499 domain-containing protein [Shimia marina]CUH53270.1 hypothetical protein SHM7688_02723 [Shimia marina]SFD81076.1 Protein of unknown function [Shimia marina]
MAIVIGLIVFLAAGLAYVRLAPSDPAKWHRDVQINHDSNSENSVRRMVVTGSDGLAKFAEIAAQTPNTSVLAGSVEEGMITFITRTKVMGYPDYTTAIQDGELLKIFGRSRFGLKDFGVNAARVDGWIEAL